MSEGDLNEKSNKNVYVKNEVIRTVIKHCKGEKKWGKSKIDGFRKKLMVPECPENEVKTKIGNIFVNEKKLEEYSVKIYKIDPCFYEHYRKKNTSWWKWV